MPSIRSVLIVVPASLRINWLREAKRWLTRPFQMHVVETSEPVPAEAELVVVNYDRVIGKHGKRVRESLQLREWDLLIADEVHMLKSWAAQRTQAVLGRPAKGRGSKRTEAVPGLIDRAARLVFLTGTPMLNRPVEMQPILGALDPQQFGDFFSFARRHCGAYQGRFGWDFSGATRLHELQEKLRRSVMIRRLKADVLKELPEKRRSVVVLPANGGARAVRAERTAYDAARESIESLRWEVDAAHAAGDTDAYEAAVGRLKGESAKLFTELARLRKAVALAKVPKVVEFVREQVDAGEKPIVWTHHHEVSDSILAGLREGDAPVECVHADGRMTKAADRDAVVQRYQTDESVRVAVLGIRAMGVGHTLTAGRVSVWAELDWTPAIVTQGEDRQHRIGQTDMVLVYHLVLDGSLDVDMAEALVQKQEIADRALDKVTAAAQAEPVVPTRDRDPRPRTYPAATDEDRRTAAEAVLAIDALCDGVRERDGMGWSGVTRRAGHSLAEQARAGRAFTDGQCFLARKLARIHRRQLPEALAEALGLGGAR